MKIVKYNNNTFVNDKYHFKKELTEKQLEFLIIKNIESIEKGMTFLYSQYHINGGKIDILARDKKGILCIIELKIVSDCIDSVFQCLYYPTQFEEETRMILICPNIERKIANVLLKNTLTEIKFYYIDNNNKILINKYK